MGSMDTADTLAFLTNLGDSFHVLFGLLQIIFALIGVVLFGMALMDAYAIGTDHRSMLSSKDGTVGGVIVRLGVATILTALFYVLDLTQNTLSVPVSSGSMSYTGGGPTPGQLAALRAVVLCFGIAGYIAFGKGWMLLDKHFNGGREGISGPIWHIIGGTMLVYIEYWLPFLLRIFGFDIGNMF